MGWIKDTYLDIIVLILIIFFGFYTNETLKIVIWVYSVLLLIGKVAALFMPFLQKKAEQSTAPAYLYHLIYGATVVVLLFLREYYLGGVWILIWAFSTFSASKSK